MGEGKSARSATGIQGNERAVLLRIDGTALLLDVAGPHLPRVLHWGSDPGPLDQLQVEQLANDLAIDGPDAGTTRTWRVTLLPSQSEQWTGRPALQGHRQGRHVFPRLRLASDVAVTGDEANGWQVVAQSADGEFGLAVTSELRLEPSGVIKARHVVSNTGADTYTVDALTAVLPVPAQAREILDLTGKWSRERSPQRTPFQHGTRLRESRRGRTGHDATLLMVAGTTGFGFGCGEVWGTHVAWSGNHVHLAERSTDGSGSGGHGVLGGGELLLPGEVRLEPGETYATPWVLFSWSDQGLDGMTARLHRWVRSRPNHPTSPRPLVLNTWEAVYFDHNFAKLEALAERAAEIGVERFVLDDGWFMGRRDDTAGLGDWFVDPAVWPDGLRPLADRVRELGMEFGLWFEPEMVNPDSDLARNHPDWILADPGRWPIVRRHQVVLDIANPEAYEFILGRISTLVDEIGISYIKWDHNRDMDEATHQGSAGIHLQTLAAYRLFDELKQRHPGLEIESCSSGGARADLGVLDHTDRIWGSDTNDALERQQIQRWTGLLIPPELIGSHVGPPRSHTTGRVGDLELRCITALFAHAGLEWDVTTCSPQEVDHLRGWAEIYKRFRSLLHIGTTVRVDHPEDSCWFHGLVAPDLSEALFSYVRLASGPDMGPGRLRFAGLDPDRDYRVRRLPLAGDGSWIEHLSPDWWKRGETVATGRSLAQIGMPAPALHPERAVLLHLEVVKG